MSSENPNISMNFSCPSPTHTADRISMAHGGGGKVMADFITQRLLPLYQPQIADPHTRSDSRVMLHDSAVFPSPGERLAFTTDSYVVHPLFFPGGDIGTLAINGTINDLAMAGAVPKHLSLSFILEEGLPLATLDRVLASIARTANAAGVSIVTGDTKVVERGKADQLYINTAGIGVVTSPHAIHPRQIREGDAVIVSGDIARHGVAVMGARMGDVVDFDVLSDCAPLHTSVQTLLAAGIEIHCLRDITRGGLASGVNELADSAGLDAILDEKAIPVDPKVAAFCELLGIDPIYVANEGRFVCVLPASQVSQALEVLHRDPMSQHASLIGTFAPRTIGCCRMRTPLGTERLVPMLSGEQLPRIC